MGKTKFCCYRKRSLRVVEQKETPCDPKGARGGRHYKYKLKTPAPVKFSLTEAGVFLIDSFLEKQWSSVVKWTRWGLLLRKPFKPAFFGFFFFLPFVPYFGTKHTGLHFIAFPLPFFSTCHNPLFFNPFPLFLFSH
jgi:hypothetical protein